MNEALLARPEVIVAEDYADKKIDENVPFVPVSPLLRWPVMAS